MKFQAFLQVMLRFTRRKKFQMMKNFAFGYSVILRYFGYYENVLEERILAAEC